jgi:hypothetical protein
VNTPLPDLGDLLRDAVEEVEPADRLGAIRARAAAETETGHAARPWWYAAGGVVLATAAAVTAFAVLGQDDPGGSGDHDDHVATEPPAETMLVPVYFVGETPRGPRLFREYDEATGTDALNAALDRIQQPASDPDYGTSWPSGSLDSASVHDGVIHVELGAVDMDLPEIGHQQLVYTLQAAVGERLPVHLSDGAELVARPQTDVLSQVVVNDPTEGLEVHDGFTARGAANSYEANVPWELRDENDEVVKRGYAMAAGYGDRLYRWEARVDVRGLPFGFYTFVAMTDDASGGAEGFGPDTDTRTIIVR